MTGYRGSAGKGTKIIDGKKYTLCGWLTASDKQRGSVVLSLRKKYSYVRVMGSKAPFSVWVK
jgi:hypothetical protein